uniref:Uncharacterized protein n=2 Tax=Oryza sativa subsp. japonica TaxID=39947 RepID=Q8S5Y1_ORYSJ|nr:Hypothetical protein [Oryza sativa Japonica Group]ABF94819.1 hypothetical protein LOC_Os03g13120 [Oryza sativa Japonica Group]
MAAANLAHAPPPPVPNLARAVGAPPEKRIEVVWERENTLLSFGRAAAHAAVAFVKFNVQEYNDLTCRRQRFTGWRQNAAQRQGAGNEFNSQGCDDEFVPETQQDVPIEEIGIGTMLHNWLRAISEYEKPSIDMETIEKAWADEKKAIADVDYEGNPRKVNTSSEKKACVDEGKSISDAETDDEGVGVPEKKACIAERKSISDAETDDEGVGVPRNLHMKDLHDIMFPTYTQDYHVYKCTNYRSVPYGCQTSTEYFVMEMP